MVCPSCSHVNDGNSAFCVNCGAALRASAPADPSQPRAAVSDSRSVTINLQIPKELGAGLDYVKKLGPSQRWYFGSAAVAALSGFLPWREAVSLYGAGSQSLFSASGPLYSVMLVVLAAVVGLRLFAPKFQSALRGHFLAAALLLSFSAFLAAVVGLLFVLNAGSEFGGYVRAGFGAYAVNGALCALFVSCYRAVAGSINAR